MVRAAHERTPRFYVGLVVWLGVAALLLRHDLGVVAVVASLLLAIYVFGLRDKFDTEDTASAYAVFNRGGQAIAGTLTAGQLDLELRGGGGVNRDDDGRAINNNKSMALRLAPTNQSVPSSEKVNDAERLRRRKAAAAAAERRAAARTQDKKG